MRVDAAMAGSAMLLPEIRSHWDGIEAADSIVVNAHKWLAAVFGAHAGVERAWQQFRTCVCDAGAL